jgi:hypothetical protein
MEPQPSLSTTGEGSPLAGAVTNALAGVLSQTKLQAIKIGRNADFYGKTPHLARFLHTHEFAPFNPPHLTTGNKMTDREIELVKNYPEAAAFAGVAASVWNGSTSPAKIEMVVTGKLYAALKNLLHKDIQTVFLTDSDIRHIKRKHGSNEAARGQENITPDDFAPDLWSASPLS